MVALHSAFHPLALILAITFILTPLLHCPRMTRPFKYLNILHRAPSPAQASPHSSFNCGRLLRCFVSLRVRNLLFSSLAFYSFPQLLSPSVPHPQWPTARHLPSSPLTSASFNTSFSSSKKTALSITTSAPFPGQMVLPQPQLPAESPSIFCMLLILRRGISLAMAGSTPSMA